MEEEGKEGDSLANISPELVFEKVLARVMGGARPKACNTRRPQPGRNVLALVALLWLVIDPDHPSGTNHSVSATKSLKLW